MIGLLIWFTQFIGPQAYNYLIGASGLSGFIAWLGIAISHFRFRRAFIKQGHNVSELTYHAALFPFGPLFAFGLCIVVILCQNLDAFVKFDWQSIAVTYMTIPVFIVLYLYYKLKYGSHLIPLEEVDLSRKTKGESYETEDK